VDNRAARPADRTVGAPEDEPADLVRAALAGAQRIARTRPKGRLRRRRGAAEGQDAQRRRGGYSGPAPDDTDPQELGSVLAGYIGDRGWDRPLAEARVFADWTSLVGADVAAHCAPAQLREGELRVTAESTAWATQLRLLAASLLARLADELGPDVVHKVVITGPVGPSWRHGPRSVRGARGPRDTYG
jgi:predicted nucleic acid-binding Zn ribbon protein